MKTINYILIAILCTALFSCSEDERSDLPRDYYAWQTSAEIERNNTQLLFYMNQALVVNQYLNSNAETKAILNTTYFKDYNLIEENAYSLLLLKDDNIYKYTSVNQTNMNEIDAKWEIKIKEKDKQDYYYLDITSSASNKWTLSTRNYVIPSSSGQQSIETTLYIEKNETIVTKDLESLYPYIILKNSYGVIKENDLNKSFSVLRSMDRKPNGNINLGEIIIKVNKPNEVPLPEDIFNIAYQGTQIAITIDNYTTIYQYN